MPEYSKMTGDELRRRLAMCRDRMDRADTTEAYLADMKTEQDISDAIADRYAAGFLAHGNGDPRPTDIVAAEGWDEAARSAKVRVEMPTRPEGYWHAAPGVFD